MRGEPAAFPADQPRGGGELTHQIVRRSSSGQCSSSRLNAYAACRLRRHGAVVIQRLIGRCSARVGGDHLPLHMDLAVSREPPPRRRGAPLSR